MRFRLKLLLLLTIFFSYRSTGLCSYFPYNSSNLGTNIGLGTSTPGGGFTVINGNVGIGTWKPAQLVDVSGVLKASSFTGDASGLTGTPVAGWSLNGTSVTSPFADNVGIGTTTPQTALAITNGNVGIGTVAPQCILSVMNNNVGIGTDQPQAMLDVYGGTQRVVTTGSGAEALNMCIVYYPDRYRWRLDLTNRNSAEDVDLWASPANDAQSQWGSWSNPSIAGNNRAALYLNALTGGSINGDIGIGTLIPHNRLSVNGSIAIAAATNSNFTLNSGPSGGLIVENNVGIGTITPQGGLVVTTGNMGIGTWAPNETLYVNGSVGIGAGTTYMAGSTPANGLQVQGNVGIGTFGPSGNNLEVWNGAVFSVMNAGDAQFTNVSSRTMKTNIKPYLVRNIANRILKVPVVTYDFKPQFCADQSGCQNRLGLIAEDFHQVLHRGSPKEINDSDVQMALWLAVQQLHQQYKKLEKIINSTKNNE